MFPMTLKWNENMKFADDLTTVKKPESYSFPQNIWQEVATK